MQVILSTDAYQNNIGCICYSKFQAKARKTKKLTSRSWNPVLCLNQPCFIVMFLFLADQILYRSYIITDSSFVWDPMHHCKAIDASLGRVSVSWKSHLVSLLAEDARTITRISMQKTRKQYRKEPWVMPVFNNACKCCVGKTPWLSLSCLGSIDGLIR